ncbi:HNH endonuclease [Streptomyces sp. NPDC006872]|uniref:HNH endonuclease n=1 Tax=Streptomyces sp. NPDC006872 TaxID=3155720 RepID=UPI0034004CB6
MRSWPRSPDSRPGGCSTSAKELHGRACQICETRLQYRRRPYSEAARIRGLGSPHDGPDELPNLLCLCPNHHVLFDGLEICIDIDGVVRRTHEGNSLGRLRRHVDHEIDETYLRYHRTLCELNSLTRK